MFLTYAVRRMPSGLAAARTPNRPMTALPNSTLINHILNEERFTMHLSHLPRPQQPFLKLVLLILLAIILGACGASAPAASTAAAKTPVSIQLAWTHEYSSASFYAAEKNGHFAAQNLAVQLD